MNPGLWRTSDGKFHLVKLPSSGIGSASKKSSNPLPAHIPSVRFKASPAPARSERQTALGPFSRALWQSHCLFQGPFRAQLLPSGVSGIFRTQLDSRQVTSRMSPTTSGHLSTPSAGLLEFSSPRGSLEWGALPLTMSGSSSSNPSGRCADPSPKSSQPCSQPRLVGAGHSSACGSRCLVTFGLGRLIRL